MFVLVNIIRVTNSNLIGYEEIYDIAYVLYNRLLFPIYSELQWVIASYCELQWATVSYSELQWVTASYSELLRVKASYSEL